jgi:hypothetical protein
MKLIYICLLSLFVLLSCSKERNIHITAKNAVTGQPYAGLTYYVVEEKEGNNGTDYKTVAKGSLNEQGEIVESVKIRKNRSYVIRLDPPPNWCYMNEISYSYTIHGEKNPKFDFKYSMSSYLTLNINNVNCGGNNDIMNFRSRYSYSDWEGWSTDRNGCYSLNSPGYVEVPSGWRIYEWKVNRNGVITNHTDSIFLDEAESGTFNMNY